MTLDRRACPPGQNLPAFVRHEGRNLGPGRVIAVWWRHGETPDVARVESADVVLRDPPLLVLERLPLESIFDLDNVAGRVIGAHSATPEAGEIAALEVG